MRRYDVAFNFGGNGFFANFIETCCLVDLFLVTIKYYLDVLAICLLEDIVNIGRLLLCLSFKVNRPTSCRFNGIVGRVCLEFLGYGFQRHVRHLYTLRGRF